MAKYADILTKKELIDNGITDITVDGKVYRDGNEIQLSTNTTGYKYFFIYVKNEDGSNIKVPYRRKQKYITAEGKETIYIRDTYVFKTKTVSLQRAIWAWYHGEVPSGLVIDHIDNDRTNNTLSNLQPLTPGENIKKERDETWGNREIKCKLNKPLKFYEDKLMKYIKLYSEAKAVGDAKAAHRLRGNISQTKARIRYYLSHKGVD